MTNDKPTTEELAQRVDHLEDELETVRDQTVVEDDSGQAYSLTDLQNFGLTRRQALYALGILAISGGSLVTAVRHATRRSRAADTSVGYFGEPGSPVDVYIDQLRDEGDDVVADIDDTGAVDWQSRGLTNVGSLDTDDATVNHGIVRGRNTERIDAAAQDGADADARLDNALSAASDGTVIYLENATYSDARTISQARLVLEGTDGGTFGGTTITGNWTLDGRVVLQSCRIDGDMTFNSPHSAILFSSGNGGSHTVDADQFRLVGCTCASVSVTFNSGTANGVVDASTGVSVTDNGSNLDGDTA